MLLHHKTALLGAILGLAAGLVGARVVGTASREQEAPAQGAEKEHPGVERWSVKCGGDSLAPTISLTPTPATIAALGALPRPAAADGEARVPPVETTVYTIQATVYSYKEEGDGDEHLACRDGNDTMICEIPRPDFLPASCPWKAQIGAVREAFVARFHPGQQFTDAAIHARITGVGFFDHLHGARGATPNAVELHPVIGLEVIP